MFGILTGTFFAASAFRGYAGPPTWLTFAFLEVVLISTIVAAYQAYRRNRQRPAVARTWIYIILATLLLGVSVSIEAFAAPAFPAPATRHNTSIYTLAASYVFFFLLLISMTRLRYGLALTHVRYLLDTAIMTLIAGVSAWLLVPRMLTTTSADNLGADVILTTTYSLANLALVFGVLACLLGLKTFRWRTWEILVVAGMVMAGISHLGVYLSGLGDSGDLGAIATQLLPYGRLSGYYLLFMSAIHFLQADSQKSGKVDAVSEFEGTKWSDAAVALLLIAALTTFISLALTLKSPAPNFWLLFSASISLGALTVARTAAVNAENARLFSRSVTDYATGLFNQRYFQTRLREEVERATRYNYRLTLVVLDIDDFGLVNDIHGHPFGDRILGQVAERIKALSRVSDVACRIGGDEFALILPNANSLASYSLANRLQKEIRALSEPENLSLSISGGIATFPDHALETTELQKKADGALYWTKFHGKEQIVIYDPDVVRALDASQRTKRAEEGAYLNAVYALAASVDYRSHGTQYHSKHVASLATLLGIKMGLPTAKVRLLEIAALLHDVGKISIPDAILQKSTPLTADERGQFEEHPALSQKILTSSTVGEILPWVLSHHERWDGTGYPQRLHGEEIPLEARMLAVCNAFDAMTSDRPYREALSREAAIEELQTGKGSQFDPEIVDKFVEVLGQVQYSPG